MIYVVDLIKTNKRFPEKNFKKSVRKNYVIRQMFGGLKMKSLRDFIRFPKQIFISCKANFTFVTRSKSDLLYSICKCRSKKNCFRMRMIDTQNLLILNTYCKWQKTSV